MKKNSSSHVAKNWNQLRIVADKDLIKVWVNETQTVELKLKPGNAARGYIGLQHQKGKILFRKIFLRPLATSPLFDGKTLAGWDVSSLQASTAVVKRGEINLTGGSGQVESKKRFGDFVFSLHCKTNSEGLNSGVFFRCIPGELMNGYESQIQNQFEGDPAQPTNWGTGAIFRRKPARRVNASDKKWFAKTIVMTGPHVAVWVNGYQVVDWTDKRKPDKNPRRGLRLEPGTIIFQGHDPTTDISFRNIFAKEQSRRWLK